MSPHPEDFSPSDNSSHKTDSGLSSNVWNSMRSEPNASRPQFDKSQSTPSSIDFNHDIYGSAAKEQASTKVDQCPADSRNRDDLNFMSDLKRYADKNFDRVDTNKDGFMSRDEMDAALKDPCLQGEDRAAVEILKKNVDELEGLSNDEFGPETKGISKEDLKEFGKIEEKHTAASDLYGYADKNWQSIDKDGDGFLNSKELDEAIKSADPKSLDKQMLEKMRSQYEDLQGKSNDEWGPESKGISKDDLMENIMDVGWNENHIMLTVGGDVVQHWLDKEQARKRPY